jgi:DNA-binding LacI/PurR family transcriptional regulator
VHENAHVYTQRRPNDTLARLVERAPHDCWLLVLSTAALQGWFVRHGVPCVLAGSPQNGIALPSVDVDFFATCRHAALTLLRLGHRHILFVNEKSGARGYTFSQTGFLQGVADYGDLSVEVAVRRFRPDERVMPAQLARHFRRDQPATAVVVMTAGRCLGVLGCLAQLGLRVPRDVSLICRSSGSFLEHMVPYPAHYDFRPDEYAWRLARHVLGQVRRTTRQASAHRLMAKFVRGESIAPPPPVTSG